MFCQKLLDKFIDGDSSSHRKGVESRMFQENLDEIDVYNVVNSDI